MLTKFNKNNSFYYFIHNGLITDNLGDSMDDLVAIQEKLFDFGLTMSGFQFVGLVLENSITSKPLFLRVAYFILSIGFILSLFGCVVSYITFKFLRSIKNENIEFIEESIVKYNGIFMLSYIVPFCNSVLFIVPLNILIYNILDVHFCIIFNVFSGIMFLTGLVLHQLVIVKKQKYKVKRKSTSRIENGIELTNREEDVIVQRRFSKHIEDKKKQINLTNITNLQTN